MKHLSRHMIAILAMMAGAVMVVGMTFWMNALSRGPERAMAKASTQFKLEKRRKKKLPKAARPKPKRRTRPRAVAHAPTPNLASQLSGVSLELPNFDDSELLAGTGASLWTDVKKNLVMTENTVDKKPVPRRRIAPTYPPKAQRRGITGYVTMKLLIDRLGHVEQVRVLDAKPEGVFEDSAVASIRRWEWKPAVYHGDAVAMEATQTVHFRLN